jgi:hypothetical protein
METGPSCKYTLLVNTGAYFSDSVIGLVWEVIKHRFAHLRRDGKWRD